MEFLTALLKSMPGAVGQGLIWGIMAIGVYITYRILDVADLTVDGSLAAHYENTLLITDGEPELLTVDENGEPA